MRLDCRHFTGSTPCAFHKQDGRACERCSACSPALSRILIVKLAAAGDVLRTTSILPALRERHAGAEITWITERSALPLLEGNPLIDRLIPRDAAIERLMVETFDLAFGLDPDEAGGAIAALARAGARAGYVLDERGRVVPVNDAASAWWRMGLDDGAKRENRRTYQDLLYEICGLPLPAARPQLFLPADLVAGVRARFASRLAPCARALVLNTGGGDRWRQKKWTRRHYAEFIRLARARSPECAVIVAGGPEEVELNALLLAGITDAGVIDGGCDNPVGTFAAIVGLGDVLVTSDSLALHVATALHVPAVVFVGPTSPWELELYGDGEAVHADVPCLACYRRRCPQEVTCMDLLTPEQVLDAVARVGRRRPAAPVAQLA